MSRSSARTPCTWHRQHFGVAVVTMSLIVLVAESSAQAPPPVHSYWVNDGKDDTFQSSFGEFAADLGGTVPFIRLLDTGVTGGHRYARCWAAGAAGMSFEAMMRIGILDIAWLDSQVDTYCVVNGPLPPTVLPFPTSAYQLESGPHTGLAWWLAAGGTIGQRPIMMWPYRLNGGAVMICIRVDPTTGEPSLNSDPQVLLMQYTMHHNDFQISRNRWQDDPNAEFEFEFKRPKSGWGGPLGAPILSPDEAAIEAGDVVLITQENVSDSIWIALQRAQEANWFLRNQFAPAPPKAPAGTYPAFSGLMQPNCRTFLHGYSYGALMSNTLALMQPKIYAGATAMAIDDIGYGFQDKLDLQIFNASSLGQTSFISLADPLYAYLHNLVDGLDIRFDDGSGKWDLAALSMNRRPSNDTLRVPVYGLVGDEDFIFNHHWALRDGLTNSNQRTTFQHFREHNTTGIVPGLNEYAIYNGTEWQTAKNAGATTPFNVNLVPTASPPAEVFPDPYSHTLRHPVHTPTHSTFLTELDLAGSITPASANHKVSAGNVKTLGQGIWPGVYDNLRVANVDYDSKIEIVFGNIDGFVHVLEFSDEAGDPYKLKDEWRSPYLGRQVTPMAGAGTGSNARGYFATARGEVWKIKPLSSGGFEVVDGAPIAAPGTPHDKFLYDGVTSALYIGDFDPNFSGAELIAVNRFLDWSMFSVTGASVGPNARLARSTRVVGPGLAAVVDADPTDTARELLIPAMDGHVWLVDPYDSNAPKPFFDTPDVFIPFTGFGLYRVEPVYFNGSSLPPTHLLVFGRNDARNDANPALSTDVVLLFDFTTKALLATFDTIPYFWSFEWTLRPAVGGNTAEFVTTDGQSIQKIRLSLSSGVPIFSSLVTKAVIPPDPFDLKGGERICALEGATFALGGTTQFHLVVATSHGRIYVLDSSLESLRESDKEGGIPGGGTPVDWHCNRTLGRVFACDFAQDPVTGTSDFYFGDYGQLHHLSPARYRLGSLSIPSPFAVPGAVWSPSLAGLKQVHALPLTRSLLFRDLDGVPGKEPYVFGETGTAIVNTSSTPHEVREYQTIMHDAALFGDGVARGGHIYEFIGDRSAGGRYLSNFHVPRDPSIPYGDYRSGSDWWYPAIGSNRMTGQVAGYEQSVVSQMVGTSMKAVQLRKTSGASPTWHVVHGTYGGYVYAVEPGTTGVTSDIRPSNLSFVSQDLGWQVIGLDAGDLDNDGENDLAVGTMLDTGDFVDWDTGVATKNRGHLYVLKPQPSASGSNGSFAITDLNGDAQLGGPGTGIGAGVTGVKIDDVNNDGQKEIWCGDGIGHIYLFKRDTGTGVWSCIYRSGELGCFPGAYNNIHPIKEMSTSSPNFGKTVRLLVSSPGYVMLFQVDPSVLLP